MSCCVLQAILATWPYDLPPRVQGDWRLGLRAIALRPWAVDSAALVGNVSGPTRTWGIADDTPRFPSRA
eukprot:11182815-Lingulodinium_polyedra.AAC.1